ncbi:hypothetical protein J7L02_00260 [Candidatus Woesearchaeota archaeon]|nr:hypothetical protein [Candidatus Woesearchaeota archaeon]
MVTEAVKPEVRLRSLKRLKSKKIGKVKTVNRASSRKKSVSNAKSKSVKKVSKKSKGKQVKNKQVSKSSKKASSQEAVKAVSSRSKVKIPVTKVKADKELITKVVKYLVGEEALPIVFYLRGKHRVSEFKIAEDLGLEIHVLRNLLYRLLEHNILTFKRKKDKIKGWYISYWDFNEHEIPYLEIKLKEEKLAKLKARLEREKHNEFYMCKNACVRMTFEEAMDFNFHCPECGEVMQLVNNARTIANIEQQIQMLEKEINALKAKYKFFKRINVEV